MKKLRVRGFKEYDSHDVDVVTELDVDYERTIDAVIPWHLRHKREKDDEHG